MGDQEPAFSSADPGATPLDRLLAPIVRELPRNTSLSPLRYDLNAGVPDRASLPASSLAAAAVAVLEADPGAALTYGGQQGFEPLRAWIARTEGVRAGLALRSDTVTLTSGSAHGLQNVALTFLAEGDTVILGAPTYPGAIRTFRARGARVVTVPQDRDGLDPDALASTLDALRGEGARVKLIYVVPNYDNPTGATLPLERRQAIVRMAHEHGVLIVEDDAYAGLDIDGVPPPSMFAVAEGRGVLRLGTFSKTVASGLRVAWILAEPHVVAALVHMRFDNGASPFLHRVVLHFLETPQYAEHVGRLQSIYRERRDAAASALREYAEPYVRFELPAGGFFLWLQLNEPLTAAAVAAAAAEREVAVTPGPSYFATGGGERALRLVYSALPPADLQAAIARLGEAMAAVAESGR
ncbi:MAG: PLP-dependent aminotransferase family protein [Chloroflexi bacterium]|nr:PLP-dependent aminotransferase family protein [Chloroflexota bacterium]